MFCVMGAVNTAASLAIIFFLMEDARWHYMAANLAGYIYGLFMGFLLHRNVSFGETALRHRPHGQIAPFFAVFAVAYPFQLAVLYALVEGMGLAEGAGQVIACAAYVVVSYLGNKFVTFRRRPGASS